MQISFDFLIPYNINRLTMIVDSIACSGHMPGFLKISNKKTVIHSLSDNVIF